MRGFETSIGGRQEAFPETVWSSILSDRGPDPTRRHEKLNRLCSLYWRPVYRLIRAAHGKPVEEAKDLTQAFFCRLLEDDGFVERWRPEDGRFRHFLKGALNHFLIDAGRESSRLRRGGDRALLSLDVTGLETGQALPDPKAGSPDAVFDRQWARDVVAHSLARLRETLAAEGKEEVFRVYEAYEMGAADPESVSYRQLAERFSISEPQVTNHLHNARRRFQDILVEELSASVTTREELERELRELFSS